MQESEEVVRNILSKVHAVITDSHLVYTSGKHGSAYVNKDAVYPSTFYISQLCQMIADAYMGDKVEVVIGPAVGGVILSNQVAHRISSRVGHEILGIYADKDGARERQLREQLTTLLNLIISAGEIEDLEEVRQALAILQDSAQAIKGAAEVSDGFVIKRGYDKLVKDKNVLVVEDILTTGGSVAKVVQAVRQYGGNVIGVGALVNRGQVTAQMLGDVPKFHALLNVQLEAWDEGSCALCAAGIPINTDVGKGREFLAKRAASAA